MRSSVWYRAILLLPFLSMAGLAADGPVLYRLKDGSTFLNDCPICAHLPIILPLEGTFVLKLKSIGDVTDWYEIDSIDFRAPVPGAADNVMTG